MSGLLSYVPIAFGLVVAAALACPAHAVSYLKFHVPHAEEIFVAHINNGNLVTGTAYSVESNLYEAFIRAADGTIATFNIDGKWTGASDINNSGAIVGFYNDGPAVAHGFVRSPDGSIVSFDVPGATQCAPGNINDGGAITGTFVTPDDAHHGFLRNPDGSIVTFDAGPGGGTDPYGITSDSTVAGAYYDGNTHHGFVRYADGSITIFDPPRSTDTEVAGMNDAGEITGEFTDTQSHGFIRKTDGGFTIFAIAQADRTVPRAINNSDVVTGVYLDKRSVSHGFLRYPNGKSETFDTSFASASSVDPRSINDQGTVAGDLGISPKHRPGRRRGFIRIGH